MTFHREMRFSSFLKLLAFSLVRVPWRCWEFWFFGLTFALLAMSGSAPLARRVLCAAGVLAILTVGVCFEACRRLIVAGKATDSDADAMWKSLFGRATR